jgi:hypothetical protein
MTEKNNDIYNEMIVIGDSRIFHESYSAAEITEWPSRRAVVSLNKNNSFKILQLK